MNKSITKNAPSFGRFSLNCFISALTATAALLILCGISAIILNFTECPENFYSVIPIALYIISSLLCGVLAKRKNGCYALFCGLAGGCMMAALLFVISLAFVFANPQAPLWQLPILPAGAVLGAIFTK